MARFAGRVALAAVILSSSLVASAHIAAAQDRRQNEPGQFDFYVLARSAAAAAMRGAALLLCRARPVAAIRKRLPGILPATGAAARSQHRLFHARSDAGAAPDLQRMG